MGSELDTVGTGNLARNLLLKSDAAVWSETVEMGGAKPDGVGSEVKNFARNLSPKSDGGAGLTRDEDLGLTIDEDLARSNGKGKKDGGSPYVIQDF